MQARPGLAAVLAVLAAGLAASASAETRRNGFLLEPASVDTREILGGGPPRDGIPALDHPEHAGADYRWDDDEIVIGVVEDGQARAYPIALLVWHELVNDTLGGRAILVSYCPLCGTAMVFDRRVEEGTAARRFGVSGLLYRSDLLMYDHETESLWSQISAEAVTGSSLGKRLRMLRSRTDRWGAWRKEHPDTTVLTRDTGHSRNYRATPYGDYSSSERLLFPAKFDKRYHPKMPTLGLRVPGGAARAYPAIEIQQAGGAIAERFEGHDVRVAYDAEAQGFRVDAPDPVEVVEGFWFAWSAFHPETTVATAPEE